MPDNEFEVSVILTTDGDDQVFKLIVRGPENKPLPLNQIIKSIQNHAAIASAWQDGIKSVVIWEDYGPSGMTEGR